MANQTASPREAEVARTLLKKLAAMPANPETPRILSREDIAARPDDSDAAVTVSWYSKGFWTTMEARDLMSDGQFLPGDEATVEDALRRYLHARKIRWGQ